MEEDEAPVDPKLELAKKKFPALSLPDDQQRVQQLVEVEKKDSKDAVVAKDAVSEVGRCVRACLNVCVCILTVNNTHTHSQLEALMPRTLDDPSQPIKTERENRNENRHDRRRDDHNRSRHRRSRSRSHDRHRRRRSRDRRRRSHSRSRSRSRSPRESGSRMRHDRGSSRWGQHQQPEKPAQPVVSQVYDGKVTSIMQFGCFVQLEGVRGRHEGLVHISQLRQEGRVKDVSDVVKRGQRVKIKVLSITGAKMSLSMKVRVHV